MKIVHSPDMVAHLFANRSQDTARTSSQNFYFNGPSLFSYGSHFVVAHWLETGAGAVLLWNSDSYSVSTSRHQGHARNALTRYTWDNAWHIPGIKADDVRSPYGLVKLAARMLETAGGKFAEAGNTARRSGKRDGLFSEGMRRASIADKLAAFLLEGKGDAAEVSKETKAAARAIRATVAKLPADALGTSHDNAAEKEVCNAAARVIGKEEARERIRRDAERVRCLVDEARGQFAYCVACGILDEAGKYRGGNPASVATMYRRAKDAANLADIVNGLAKQFAIRRPKMPDAAALVHEYEAATIAASAKENEEDARRNLARAERDYRRRMRGNVRGRNIGSAARWLSFADDRAAPGELPAWMSERAQNILARAKRAYRIASAVEDLAHASMHDIRNGDRHANAGREYREAIRRIERGAAHLPAHHPALREHAAMIAGLPSLRGMLAHALSSFAQEDAAQIEAWREGKPGASVPRDVGPLLRLERSEIVTSWGARVPVGVAPMLWKIVNHVRANGAAQDITPPAQVGPFRLERIEADGAIVVGCHVIAFAELEHIARRLEYIA
jgi:hypothetical protein